MGRGEVRVEVGATLPALDVGEAGRVVLVAMEGVEDAAVLGMSRRDGASTERLNLGFLAGRA